MIYKSGVVTSISLSSLLLRIIHALISKEVRLGWAGGRVGEGGVVETKD